MTVLRKPLVILAIALLLVLAVLTLLVPFLHEALLLFALYLMATEFESGRALVKGTRRRWPFLSRLIARAHGGRWAPRALGEFDDLTNPAK
ncbi:MAG TPA: hypothetical protein VGI94_03760 [Reyranella sp.]